MGTGTPEWMERAFDEYKRGTAEIPGPQHNQRILGWFADVGATWVHDDETPNCAAFVGAMLKRSGLSIPAPVDAIRARAYLSWGSPLHPRTPPMGAIAVLKRGDGPGPEVLKAPGHVGILWGWTPTGILLLGANQGDKVGIDWFPPGRILGYRWPSPSE